METERENVSPFVTLAPPLKWTHFYDMHSGGGKKEKWEHIFIQANEEEAKKAFMNKFGHDPEYVTCDCCGRDYSIHEFDSLEEGIELWNSDGMDTMLVILAKDL